MQQLKPVGHRPPAIYFKVSTGEVGFHDDIGNMVTLAFGYSGAPGHINATESERLFRKGPIPRGAWTMGRANDHPTLGPVTIGLYPREETETFGRSGFFIHGDNGKRDNSASSGCIILPRVVRQAFAALGVNRLTVMD